VIAINHVKVQHATTKNGPFYGKGYKFSLIYPHPVYVIVVYANAATINNY